MCMVRRLGTMLVIAGVFGAVSLASAFSMGEVAATTGVQGALASTGHGNVAGTIGSVKSALGNAAATKEGQLATAGAQIGWGGKGGPAAWAAHGSNGGWVAKSGWATASAGGGWAVGAARGGGAWGSGPWNTASR
jgi:hypothetical protein